MSHAVHAYVKSACQTPCQAQRLGVPMSYIALEANLKKHYDGNSNGELSDDALLQREESERREYVRLEEREPHLRDTTYRELTGSKVLLHAWERWTKTNIMMKVRGLLSRFQ